MSPPRKPVLEDPQTVASAHRLADLLAAAPPGITIRPAQSGQTAGASDPATGALDLTAGEHRPALAPPSTNSSHPAPNQPRARHQPVARPGHAALAERLARPAQAPRPRRRPNAQAPAPAPGMPAGGARGGTVPRPVAADLPLAQSVPTATHEPAPPPPSPDPVAVSFNHLPEQTIDKLRGFLAGTPASPPPPPGTRPAQPAGSDMPLRFSGSSELAEAIRASKRAFMATGLFSVIINILMLTGPLFMLQVYDRVMTSGSIPTLVALSVLTALLYAIIGAFELVRSRIVVRIGREIEGRIGDRIFEAALKRSILARQQTASMLRELDTLRQFVASQGPLTLFDAPWTFAYLLVIFMLHWALGVLASIGAVLLLLTAWASELRSRAPLQEAGQAAARSIELAETGQRNAESIAAMGMLSAYRSRWRAANTDAIAWAMLAADRLGSMSAFSKTLRLLMQSMMLGLGAALALEGQITAGSIVAATIIFGRALAPVEQLIAHWRNFTKARDAYAKLDTLLASEPALPLRTELPAPKGHLNVRSLRVAVPQTRTLILGNVSFEVHPGQVVAVIGPSASGKSTLVRALVGLWPAAGGAIEIDGSRLDQWNGEALGRHIGFLPQDVELFAGTLRDNIARFRTDASDAAVIEAAKAAHAHDMILALPNGYDTEIGAFGMHLSAGQRQRVALARALFDSPPLVILDEPNANLDRAGDEALSAAIHGMRRRRQAVVIVSHRVQAIHAADMLLYLDRGIQRAFGPREDVLRQIQAFAPASSAAPSAPPAPSVALAKGA